MGTSNRASVSSFSAIVSISFAVSYAFGPACTKVLPHGGDEPTFPLLGRHTFVPCEGCHGPGEPQRESRFCIDCHNSDRPSPSHNPGENCSPCHTEAGWDVGVTPMHTGEPPLHTGLEHTGAPPDPNHDGLTEANLCWDCHEVDRKDLLHYADTIQQQYAWWDCGPCHAIGLPGTGWLVDLVAHPCRTPHGSKQHSTDPAAWVVACSACHPGGDTTVTDCVTCHLPVFDPDHYGLTAKDIGPTGSECTDACHPTGD